ncbi:hypothetical protein PHISP_06639, partial [Aspergillus sp. HF37]
MVLLGQRRSFDGNLCTIRYVGEVAGTTGQWYGVEWDDPTRGKHSGEHKGVRYFTCRSNLSTAGSFVRPSRPADRPMGFLEALREKYAPEFEQELSGPRDGAPHDSIEISGKVVEEVGFDKIRKQLAELQELKIVLLDGLCVAGVLAEDDPVQSDTARREIEATCPKIAELDLSRSLLSRWADVADICEPLKRLMVLKLNGNRLGPVDERLRFEGITELHLDETLLSWDEISALTYQFPSLVSLAVSANQITALSAPISDTITTLKLEHNEISSLSAVQHLANLPKLEQLSLRGNCIETVHAPDATDIPLRFPHTLKFLDLSRNRIASWLFIDDISSHFSGLSSLRISGNPLFNQPVAPSTITNTPARPMTVDEAYILTVSRLPALQVVNYGKVTPQDRHNGELYYLSLIGKELSAAPGSAERDILAKHPRYADLCAKYGEPVVTRDTDSAQSSGAVNPRSIAAGLVKMAFYLGSSRDNGQKNETMKVKEIPRSFDTYQVKAIVSRLFGLPAFQFRLVWETDELDPVGQGTADDDDWDSSEDEGEGMDSQACFATDGTGLVRREVELVDSTRNIGAWFYGDSAEASIRVEVF